jgi:hypothetical protein
MAPARLALLSSDSGESLLNFVSISSNSVLLDLVPTSSTFVSLSSDFVLSYSSPTPPYSILPLGSKTMTTVGAWGKGWNDPRRRGLEEGWWTAGHLSRRRSAVACLTGVRRWSCGSLGRETMHCFLARHPSNKAFWETAATIHFFIVY